MSKGFNEIFKKALDDSMMEFVSAERSIVVLYVSAFVSATGKEPEEHHIFNSLKGNISKKIIKDVMNSLHADGSLVEREDGTARLARRIGPLESSHKASETAPATVAAPEPSAPVDLPAPGYTAPKECDEQSIKLWARFLSREMATKVKEQYVNRGVRVPSNFLSDDKKKQAWVTEFERLIRIDKRTPAEIQELMQLVYMDKFWSSNILSPSTLREKFDRLSIQLRKSKVTYKRDQSIYVDPDELARAKGLL